MNNLLRANFFRLRRTLLFWGVIAVSAGFGAFLVYTHLSDRARYGTEFVLDNIFFGYIMIIGLIMAVAVSTFIGTEHSDGTIRNKLAVGCLRREVYLASLIAATVECFLCCAVFMLVVTAFGAPFVGFLTVDGKIIAQALLGTLLLGVALCSIYTCISMNCSHKTTTAIVCILLFFLILSASTYVSAMLDAPPESLNYSLVDGEFVSEMQPNPRYLQGTKRMVYEFFYDFLPTGQASQYFTLSFVRPLRMALCAVGIAVASTGVGLALFERKDLK